MPVSVRRSERHRAVLFPLTADWNYLKFFGPVLPELNPMLFSRLLLPFVSICLLTGTASAQQYTDLLKGRSLSQWMLPSGGDVQSGWSFDPNGTLHLVGKGDNIITKEDFGDFDLWFEYRISAKGNSGIKYRVMKYGNSWLGCEYQIQDDSAFPNLSAEHYTASLYDLFDITSPVLKRNYISADQFSVGRIIIQNHRIRHWMNGNLIIDERDDSQRFTDAVTNSKFKDQDGFGRNSVGKLMLTDHGSEVWYRNVYIRRLDGRAAVR